MKKDDLPRYYFTGKFSLAPSSHPPKMNFIKKHKTLSFIFFFFILLFAGRIIFGATILTDDFNSYTDGDLQGQGSWTANAAYDIQGTTVKEGAKAVKLNSGSDVDAYKTGTLSTNQTVTIYFYRASGVWIGAYLREVGQAGEVYTLLFGDTNEFKYYNGSVWTTIASVPANTWFYLQIEVRSSDKKARYNIDGGTWTTWDTTNGAYTNGFDKVQFNGGGSGDVYIDYIAENYYGYGATTTATEINNSKMLAFAGLGAFFVLLFDILRRILV